MPPPPPKTIAILGGGITGLSTAYYLRKLHPHLRPIILERTPRLGGWIRTLRVGSNWLETGPRSIRPAGLAGMNLLDLVEELGIESQVHYVPPSHPAATNRLLFTGGELVKLPFQEGARLLFQTVPPFERPLLGAVLRDVFKRRVREDDCSAHTFFTRRFGPDLANKLIDPMIRGITAGDSRQISAKFLFRQLYHYEQKYGSVILGALLNRGQPDVTELANRIPGYESIGRSKLASVAKEQRWSQWTLEEGLEQLVTALKENLINSGVEIRLESSVKTIKFGEVRNVPSDHIEISYLKSSTEEILHCDQVISTIPAWRLSKILRKSKPSHPSLWQLLNLISAVDVLTINLVYKDKLLLEMRNEAFGFLVPSTEVSTTPSVEGLLGIVFDSCSRAQSNDTVLTVMAQRPPPHLQPLLQQQDVDPRKRAMGYVKATLGISEEPDICEFTLSEDCIPQYQVGHYEKVDGVRMFCRAAKLPLLVAGASYDGVSVNDCVFAGRRAAGEVD